MSNAMSTSKSRWKGALLATVATTILSPLAAKAQTMSLSLSLSPLGDTTAYGGPGFNGALPGAVGGYAQGPSTTEVIPPDEQTPIYVYATVTGTQAMSSSYVNGLQFAYFNVLENAGITASEGTILSATPNAALGFAANGSQTGATDFSSGTMAVGSTSVLEGVAKPRSAVGVYSSTTTPDGTNVIVSGNSISFLIETLEYQPASGSSSYTANGGFSTTVSLAHSALANTSPYVESNYFVGAPSTPSASVGTSYTHTSYTISGSGVTLIDAEPGDAALAGTVDSTDLVIELGNFEKGITGWTNGDFDQASSVDSTDLVDTLSNFEKPYAVPAGVIAGPTALIGSVSAVPEPVSLSLIPLAGAALMRRRRASK
jgi:hypothetical protein